MKILVTGGSGFIGSHLVKRLLKDGHEVVVVDDLSGGIRDNLPENKDIGYNLLYEFSILDKNYLNFLFKELKPDRVMNLGSYAAECLSPFIRNHNYSVNVVGSANIINCCINYDVKELIFTSSIAVYGKSNPGNYINTDGDKITGFMEHHYCFPSDPYGNAKLCVERDIQIAHEQHGLNYKIFRPHNVFGTHQNINDPFRNVVGIFIKCLLEGNPLPIFGDGQQMRQFTPVDYVVEGLVSEVLPKNQIYNIGSNQSYSIKQIASRLLTLFAKEPDEYSFAFHEARHEAKHPACDHTKIQKYLGACKYDLEEKLREVVEWAKTDKGFESILPKIEVEKGMPEAWKKL